MRTMCTLFCVCASARFFPFLSAVCIELVCQDSYFVDSVGIECVCKRKPIKSYMWIIIETTFFSGGERWGIWLSANAIMIHTIDHFPIRLIYFNLKWCSLTMQSHGYLFAFPFSPIQCVFTKKKHFDRLVSNYAIGANQIQKLCRF